MSDGTAPERPRPQYGAYASPDQQRAARGLPPEQAPEPVDPALVPQDTPVDERPAAPAPRGRIIDRVVTVALLAYGLFNTLGAIPLFTDPSALLGLMQVDAQLSDYAGARTAGAVSIGVMVVGWLATTWFVWRRGARGKSMWWIALIAGVVFNLIGSAIVAIALVQDPNVLDALMQAQNLAPPAGD